MASESNAPSNAPHERHPVMKYKFTTAGVPREAEVRHHNYHWELLIDGDFAAEEKSSESVMGTMMHGAATHAMKFQADSINGVLSMSFKGGWNYAMKINNKDIPACWSHGKDIKDAPVVEVLDSGGSSAPPKTDFRFRFLARGQRHEVQLYLQGTTWNLVVDQAKDKVQQTTNQPGPFGAPAQERIQMPRFQVQAGSEMLEGSCTVEYTSNWSAVMRVNDVDIPEDQNPGPEVCVGQETPSKPKEEPLQPKQEPGKLRTLPKAKQTSSGGWCCGEPPTKDGEFVRGARSQCYLWAEEIFME